MTILKNLFLKKQLPDNFLVWCIGIPYTREQFRKCCKKTSCDFIDSLMLMYGTNDEDILWEYYLATAERIEMTINDLRKRNVSIINVESVDDLIDAYRYSNIIITTHSHRVLKALDFYGNIISQKEFVQFIPKDYNGVIDLSSCNSADFQLKCKLRVPSCTFIAVGTTSSLELRLFLYKQIVKYILKHKDKTYLEALRVIAKEIVKKQESMDDNKVLLGGQLDLIIPNSMVDCVYSSVFAPAEIKCLSHFLVQVYLHSKEESNIVADLALKADKNTEQRDFSVLQMSLKQGDKVDVDLNIYGEKCMQNFRKSILWQGRYSKCSFCYFVPADLKVNDLFCEVSIYVNGILMGEMSFVTKVTANPQFYNSEVFSKIYKKIFISYAHQDEGKVKYVAQAYKAQGVEYFYDRYILKGGDVYDEEIEKFIDSSDLFILCWSDNSAKSKYVEKEISRALIHAYPQRKLNEATLKIYPISIEPHADLPKEMKDVYNFEVI